MAVPAAPVIQARANSQGVNRVLIRAVAGALTYSIYRGEDPEPTTLLADDLDAGIYYDRDNIIDGDLLIYRATATNGDGESDYSNEVKVRASDEDFEFSPTPGLRNAVRTGLVNG